MYWNMKPWNSNTSNQFGYIVELFLIGVCDRTALVGCDCGGNGDPRSILFSHHEHANAKPLYIVILASPFSLSCPTHKHNTIQCNVLISNSNRLQQCWTWQPQQPKTDWEKMCSAILSSLFLPLWLVTVSLLLLQCCIDIHAWIKLNINNNFKLLASHTQSPSYLCYVVPTKPQLCNVTRVDSRKMKWKSWFLVFIGKWSTRSSRLYVWVCV